MMSWPVVEPVDKKEHIVTSIGGKISILSTLACHNVFEGKKRCVC